MPDIASTSRLRGPVGGAIAAGRGDVRKARCYLQNSIPSDQDAEKGSNAQGKSNKSADDHEMRPPWMGRSSCGAEAMSGWSGGKKFSPSRFLRALQSAPAPWNKACLCLCLGEPMPRICRISGVAVELWGVLVEPQGPRFVSSNQRFNLRSALYNYERSIRNGVLVLFLINRI